jgi:phosphatidylserine decarboxylase
MHERLVTRAAALVGIAAEGVALALPVAGLGLASLVLGLLWIGWLAWLGAPLIIAAIAIGAFFRDPERRPNAPDGAVIAAADGRVCDIGEGPIPDGSGSRCRRVGVFMSPLNVHINRAPVSGEVLKVEHTAGEFKAAFRDVAIAHNERNAIVFSDSDGGRYAIVQIAGYLARRIVCRVQPRDRVNRGQRVGLIMFGSRVEHFFPIGFNLRVKLGDRVRAGESVIGEPAP